ncbi:MAG: hypothetical protein ACKOEZ_07835, partial [Spartobacteria bacterium]
FVLPHSLRECRPCSVLISVNQCNQWLNKMQMDWELKNYRRIERIFANGEGQFGKIMDSKMIFYSFWFW